MGQFSVEKLVLPGSVLSGNQHFQVTSEHLSHQMGFWNVEGSNAYAVVSATLMVTIKGQTAARTGTLAYTFSKRGEAWKIDAQAWGRMS
jgi:hypothetical protein